LNIYIISIYLSVNGQFYCLNILAIINEPLWTFMHKLLFEFIFSFLSDIHAKGKLHLMYLNTQENLYWSSGERLNPTLINQVVWEALFFNLIFIYLLIYFAVPGLELRVDALSHSTSPFCVRYFQYGVSQNCLPRLASNCDPPDLCFLSS
jgi:hypothetical protein